MRRWWAGWRVALRIARREALRGKRRTAIAFIMVLLPVATVVLLDVGARTGEVSGVERLDREVGGFAARLEYLGSGPIGQTPDAQMIASFGDGAGSATPPSEQELISALPPGSRLVARSDGETAIRTDLGSLSVATIALDLREQDVPGILEITAGRAPAAEGEVAVSSWLAKRFGLGSDLTLTDGRRVSVVGVTRSGSDLRARTLTGLPATFPAADPAGVWYVATPRPVTWEQVRSLNTLGVSAISRAVLTDPPPRSAWPEELQYNPNDTAALQVLALIVVMVVIETVLLAGPAFAVGARRSRRSLALQAAVGGDARSLRRTVLATGVVVGVGASLLGGLLGLLGVVLGRPLLERISGSPLGPLDLRGVEIGPVLVLGALAAVLACLVPAVQAGRLDVVAVLAGRRAEPHPSWRSPVLGLILAVLGAVVTIAGARRQSGGEMMIAAGAVLTVLGVVAMTPWLVALLGRAGGWFPLPLRLALRDGARHRSRTAPAVAAVLATVAGVVALGIAGASDNAQATATYAPRAPMGTGVLSWYGDGGSVTTASAQADRDRYAALLGAALPDAEVLTVRGLPERYPGPQSSGPIVNDEVTTCAETPTTYPDPCQLGSSWSSSLGASTLVGAEALRGLPLRDDERRAAQAVLDRGGAALYSDQPLPAETMRLYLARITSPESGDSTRETLASVEVPVTRLQPVAGTASALVVLSDQAANALDVDAVPVSLVVPDGISPSAEDRLRETLGGRQASFSVERGDPNRDTFRLVLLGLAIGGAVLVLGGTLTATSLALADAEPDLATLGAVGATPRLRRTVAAAYAASIAGVGAVLGAAVGFVPGIAATWPLTSQSWLPEGATDIRGNPLPEHFLAIPWSLVAVLVLGLPLVAAVVTAATSRSRLPSVNRAG